MRVAAAVKQSLLAAMLAVACAVALPAAEGGVAVRSNPKRYKCRIEVPIVNVWKENYGVLLYLALPSSDAYQDVETDAYTPGRIMDIPGFGGDKCFRVFLEPEETAKRPGAVFVEFFAVLYDCETDFAKITQLYPYDKTTEDYARYTAPSLPWIDPDHPLVKKVAEEIAGLTENDLEFAQLAFRYARDEIRRVPSLERRQPLADTLKRGGAGRNINAVLVSLLRNRGIPARMAVAKRLNGTSHAWAEFYLEKYGWIPADPSINVKKDTFFGRVTPPGGDRRARGEVRYLVMNHVYGDCEFPNTVENAQPLRSGGLLEFVSWGMYENPPYRLTFNPMGLPPGTKESTPLRRLNLKLK